jgi:hypothetical protein
MIYYIYVHTHESICPIPFVIATDFQKIRWSNSTPFVCALKHNGFAYLGAQDGSVNHCFLVSDVVILEKCWRESNKTAREILKITEQEQELKKGPQTIPFG